MKILKIKGKDESVVLEEIQKEYGDNALVLSSHKERAQGLRGIFQSPFYVVTIALNEEEEKIEQVREKPYETHSQKLIEQLIEQNETQKILLSLKDQVSELQSNLKNMQDPNVLHNYRTQTGNEKLILESWDSTTPGLVKKALLQQGVEEEVVGFLLENISSEASVEEIATHLFEKMSEILLEMSIPYHLSKKVYFIGSTGVGKTTTIAKLTAYFSLAHHKKIGLFTADTYRIAAIDQLKTYADILEVPIEIIFTADEIQKNESKYEDLDYIFIDTAGRSHKNQTQMAEMAQLLQSEGEKTVFLVLNMNTTWRDIKHILDTYNALIEDFSLIVTKLDETDVIGNLLNIAYYAKKPIAYTTHGQNVPDDFKIFDRKEYMKQLLGGCMG